MEITNTGGESPGRPAEAVPTEPENTVRDSIEDQGGSDVSGTPAPEVLPTAPDYMGNNIDTLA